MLYIKAHTYSLWISLRVLQTNTHSKILFVYEAAFRETYSKQKKVFDVDRGNLLEKQCKFRE
jgi:hypothetical protein